MLYKVICRVSTLCQAERQLSCGNKERKGFSSSLLSVTFLIFYFETCVFVVSQLLAG